MVSSLLPTRGAGMTASNRLYDLVIDLALFLVSLAVLISGFLKWLGDEPEPEEDAS